MNKYANKLKFSVELRNKMCIQFNQEPGFSSERTNMYTEYTDSDDELGFNNIRVDVNHEDVLSDFWDTDYKIVIVTWKKYIDGKCIKEQKFLALCESDSDSYFTIPYKLAKKEKLELP